MAVKDETAFYATENLITTEPRRHYRTAIKPIHWQLRSLIGVSGSNAVYYPAGNESRYIQEFNPLTHRSETIAFLSFEPRCLVARDGWICCGGEVGEFVAIRLSERKNGASSGRNSAAGTTTTTATNPGGTDGDGNTDMENEEYDDFDLTAMDDSTTALGVPPRLITKTEKFGRERVNCITIWTPPTLMKLAPGAYNSAVAVLANNDKHVTLVRLDETEELDDLVYPDYVNRAVLSPDGRLLVSVSDDPYLYIHERAEKELPEYGARQRPSQRKEYEWRLLAKHHLRGQDKDDQSVRRGSFTACFSNTGQYLAVGTQYGKISVFDTDLLFDTHAPLVACFSSSNPTCEAGAVREMTFCPGPFDLLAWSEDHGAACVADMRNGFVSRQILNLCDDPAYEHIAMNPMLRPSDDDLIEERRRRLRSGATEDPNGSGRHIFSGARLPGGNDYYSDLSTEQALRIRDALDRYQMPLDETQFFDTQRERRRRRDRELQDELDREQQLTREQRERRDQRERERVHEYLGRRSAWALRSRAGGLYGTSDSLNSSSNNNSTNADIIANTSRNANAARLRQRSESMTSAVNDLLGGIRSLRNAREFAEAERRRLLALTGGGSAAAAAAAAGTSGSASTNPTTSLLQAARQSAAIPTIENEDDSADASDDDDGPVSGMRVASQLLAQRAEQIGARLGGDGGYTTGGGRGGATGVSRRRQPWGSIDALSFTYEGAGGGSETGTAGINYDDSSSSSRVAVDLLHAYSTAEAAIGSAAAGTSSGSGTGGRRGPSAAIRRERAAFGRSLLSQSVASSTLLDWEGGMTNGARRERDAADKVDKLTAGLAWSEDGTRLYIGTQGGIFEFRVNVRARLFRPSVTAR